MQNNGLKLDRNNGKSLFRRFFHFGPILTICIIKSITLQTLYLNSMWYPPNKTTGGFLNQMIFIVLSALTVLNFAMSAIMGPAYLPFGWKPKNKKHESYLQMCTVCPDTFKAPRAHHCRKCNRCVTKMDHHCPYINNCVGYGNHCHFIWFLIFAIAGCLHAAIILICSLYNGLYRDYYAYYHMYDKATVRLTTWTLVFTVFNIGLSIGVVIAVGMLFFFQMKSIIRNQTGIEDWILDKAQYRRKIMEKAAREAGDNELQVQPFIYPYNLGWKNNLAQVINFSCLPIGDGVTWPVVEKCDQYTLTCEQLAQKAEKRARTRRYRITSTVSGSWMPLWSQGFKVCIHPPLTDESRIALQIGDIVNVTRWRRHWLFGEKSVDETENNNKQNGKKMLGNGKTPQVKERIRGWFPRQCAVEFMDDNDDGEFEVETNDSKKHK